MPQVSKNWLLLYKAFYTYVFEKKEFFRLQKLLFHYLQAYSCKVYVFIKLKSNLQYRHKCQKLDAKAYIGFLVSYESVNINWV